METPCLIELELPKADRGVISAEVPMGSRLLSYRIDVQPSRLAGGRADLCIRAVYHVMNPEARPDRRHYYARLPGQTLPPKAHYIDFAAVPMPPGTPPLRMHLFELDVDTAGAVRAAFRTES